MPRVVTVSPRSGPRVWVLWVKNAREARERGLGAICNAFNKNESYGVLARLGRKF